LFKYWIRGDITDHQYADGIENLMTHNTLSNRERQVYAEIVRGLRHSPDGARYTDIRRVNDGH
jgi:hypothetical protein